MEQKLSFEEKIAILRAPLPKVRDEIKSLFCGSGIKSIQNPYLVSNNGNTPDDYFGKF